MCQQCNELLILQASVASQARADQPANVCGDAASRHSYNACSERFATGFNSYRGHMCFPRAREAGAKSSGQVDGLGLVPFNSRLQLDSNRPWPTSNSFEAGAEIRRTFQVGSALVRERRRLLPSPISSVPRPIPKSGESPWLSPAEVASRRYRPCSR